MGELSEFEVSICILQTVTTHEESEDEILRGSAEGDGDDEEDTEINRRGKKKRGRERWV